MNGNPGKQLRQEGAIKRTEAQLAIYEQKIVNDKDNRDLKKKIERAKTTVKNTKENMNSLSILRWVRRFRGRRKLR